MLHCFVHYSINFLDKLMSNFIANLLISYFSAICWCWNMLWRSIVPIEAMNFKKQTKKLTKKDSKEKKKGKSTTPSNSRLGLALRWLNCLFRGMFMLIILRKPASVSQIIVHNTTMFVINIILSYALEPAPVA